mmetsp:Transcript_47700/g.123689  ORF Transcript_47700/g.123689 Transcript_47700/m.123689 type:complete len:209 (-) Transcript_47700:1697-2323(-)|eukprot:CAMPEP_0113867974 /NCGR_PEP_ID=MMETSP0780_2-20120614/720_1 /TAXON_ID=652834 /ORGANISM="Palpitomonas bilix" /LENGTH=208 /DNA_ID=CAMNT_0000852983 /DNA_START=36 /DNA_END=662 /DNA_ORIENTATION=- /assembly_acc=CAM_ASM_000599
MYVARIFREGLRSKRVGVTLISEKEADFAPRGTRPTVVVDLDDTVVVRRPLDFVWLYFTRTGAGGAFYPQSASLLQELQKDYNVIALTARWDFCAKNTLGSLRKEGIDTPVLLSSSPLFNSGQRAQFKKCALEELNERGFNLQLGVGDRWSDYQAYSAAGMKTVLILKPHEIAEATSNGMIEKVTAVDSSNPATVWPTVFERIKAMMS